MSEELGEEGRGIGSGCCVLIGIWGENNGDVGIVGFKW